MMKKYILAAVLILSLAGRAGADTSVYGVGLPGSISGATFTTDKTIYAPRVPINKTATPFNLTATDMRGQWYTNYGSSVDIVANLPAGVNGYNACFSVDTAAKYWRLDPNGTEQFLGTSTAGDYLQSDTVQGTWICIWYRNGTWYWAPNGAWTEE
jgi:hypothetical protein